MRFAAQKDVLAAAVSWVAQAIPSRPSHPVLAGVQMAVEEDRLLLSATDNVVSAHTSIPIKEGEPGSVVVAGKLLSEALKNMPEGLVEFEIPEEGDAKDEDAELDDEDEGGKEGDQEPLGTRARITGGGAGYQLETIPPLDFPRLPKPPAPQGWLNAEDLRSAVKQVKSGIGEADDSSDMRLEGIRVEVAGETATFITTNLYRIPVARRTWRWDGEETELAATVPSIALAIMASAAKGPVGFSFPGDRGVLGLTCGDYTITSGVLAGRYPNWQRAFSKVGTALVAEVDRDELTGALQRSQVVQEKTASVRLSFSQKGLRVRAGSRSAMTEVLAAEVRGENMDCTYNLAYLLQALQVVPTPTAVLHMNGDAAGMILAEVLVEGDSPTYQQLLSAQVA